MMGSMKAASGYVSVFILLLIFLQSPAAQAPDRIDVVWNRCDVTTSGLASGTDRIGFTICTTDSSHTTRMGPAQTIDVTVGPIGHQVTQTFTIGASAGCITVFYPDNFPPIPTYYVGTYFVTATPCATCLSRDLLVGGSAMSGGCSGSFQVNPGAASVTPPTLTLTLNPPYPGPYQVNQPITATAVANDPVTVPPHAPMGIKSLTIITPGTPWSGSWGCPGAVTQTGTAPAFTPTLPGTYTFRAEATNCVDGMAWQEVTITVGGCTPSYVVNPISPETDGDFTISASLAGCPSPGNRDVEFTIVDPMGTTHTAMATTGGGGATPAVSYLHQFSNTPTTEMCGIYKLTIKNPVAEDMRGEIQVNIPDSQCKKVYSQGLNTAGDPMAVQIANCGNLQDPVTRDVVTCCNLPCCGVISFNEDCDPIPSYPIAAADLETRMQVLPQDKERTDMEELCSVGDPSVSGTYKVVDLDDVRYKIIGKWVSADNTQKRYYIVDTESDVGRNACFVGTSDVQGCDQRHMIFVVDKPVYQDHIETYVIQFIPNLDMRLVFGFYLVWMPPYEYALQGSRYSYVYGREYTDDFYCYVDEPDITKLATTPPITPDTIRKSYWCHNTNLGWYSVLGTNRGNPNDMAITPENIVHVQRWNNLTGYVVLGHITPWCMRCQTVTVP